MLKILGSVMVIVSTSYYGLSYSHNVQKRIIELNILKKIFAELYSDVEYGACSLQESFFRIGEKQNELYKCFLHQICLEIKTGSLGSLQNMFETAIQKTLTKSALKKADLEQLKTFASQLGHHQRDSQLRVIRLYLHDLDTKISELEKEKTSKQKISRVLGFASGIFIVILLL